MQSKTKIKAKQSKTNQNKAKQNKPKQTKTKFIILNTKQKTHKKNNTKHKTKHKIKIQRIPTIKKNQNKYKKQNKSQNLGCALSLTSEKFVPISFPPLIIGITGGQLAVSFVIRN